MATKKKLQLIAIASGVLCALCVLLYTNSVADAAAQVRDEALARYGGDQVEVCVASHDIAAGETIDKDDIDLQMWLVDLLPEGALTKLEDAVGKQATSPIYAGEVVLSHRFVSLTSQFEVPDGMVAVSVSAQDVQAVGGALMPGSSVDVYATGNSTQLIGSNVLVLATSAYDSDGTSSGASLTWVALAVEPSAVQELIAAEEKTQLYFALPGQEIQESASSEAQDTAAEAGESHA